MKQDNKDLYIIFVLGIVLLVWLAILIAPFIDKGIIEIINQLPIIVKEPFDIVICKNSLKTVLLFLLFYVMGIGIYISSRGNYRRKEEHGSAKWGKAKKLDKKYKQVPISENKILTQNVKLGLNAKKHRRNLNILVCGRKSVQVKQDFLESQI